jgi:hypothetical protein
MTEHMRSKRSWILCEVLRRNAQADVSEYEQRIDALGALLDQMRYRIFTIEKSRDLSRVERFSEITAFPREPWTETVAELNDYILMPAEDGRPDSLLPSCA